jgi:DNA-directed RNA polymerase sigma subunit (sigma70/sigma32)
MYNDAMGLTPSDPNDPLSVYLRELDAIQPLTRDEETVLLQHVQSQNDPGESAARRLIEAKLSLVVSIAQRHSSSGIDTLDLIEKGNEALLIALRTFTGSSSDSFANHAAKCIEQAIMKSITESQSANEGP